MLFSHEILKKFTIKFVNTFAKRVYLLRIANNLKFDKTKQCFETSVSSKMEHRKRPHGEDESLAKVENMNKFMNDMYWREICRIKRNLHEKFENLRLHPKSHEDYNYLSRRFMENYKGSSLRWKKYWEQKLDEQFEKELKEEKIKTWEEIQEKYKLRKLEDQRDIDEKVKKTEETPANHRSQSVSSVKEEENAKKIELEREKVLGRCGCEKIINSSPSPPKTCSNEESDEKTQKHPETSIEYENIIEFQLFL